MKTVAYSSPFVPVEWIAAHGLRPHLVRVRPAGDGPLAGAVHGMCPYARDVVHAALCEAEAAAAVVMTTVCDQMRRAAGVAAVDGSRPVFLLNVPSTWQTAAARGLYLDELKRLGRFLVRLGGRAPSPEDLAGVMLRYDRARSAVRAGRGRLTARQFAEATAALHGSGEALPAAGLGAVAPGGIPLALVGGPLMERDYAVLDLLERAGGRVVLDATEGGERTMPAAFDRQRLRDNPLQELAGAYFGAMRDPFRRPNSEFYEWLGHELAARRVRGVLVRRYVWCDIWHAELHRLREWSRVPVLDVDVCHDDEGAIRRTMGRIEAFLEMLA